MYLYFFDLNKTIYLVIDTYPLPSLKKPTTASSNGLRKDSMVKATETIYMLNIDSLWQYLDNELPYLVNHYHFSNTAQHEIAVEVIYEAFNEAIYWRTKHYFRPKRFNTSILSTIFEELKTYLVPEVNHILHNGEVMFGQVVMIDYLATRSTFILALSRSSY